jgi:DNA-binding protein WhiA
MSFSSEVKAELAKQLPKSRHCQIAELAAMLALDGWASEAGNAMDLHSDNYVLIQKYALLMQRIFAVDIRYPLQAQDIRRVLDTLKWRPTQVGCDRASSLLLENTCCRRAYIRGAFLAAGSISDPSKSYHFEIVCVSMPQAEQLRDLMTGFETDAKIVERKGHYVVYLKDGSQIVDMLNVMEAYVSLMTLENIRILKEMRNSVNRKVNCETANISKTVSAAVKQIEDITKIRDTIGFDHLPPHLKEMALLRLEYPDAPLKELGAYLDPPVGKSGVNHRLRRLSEIADGIL